MKFVLPLTPNYIKDWTTWDAVRELLQNAMDARDNGGQDPVVIWNNGCLTISSPGQRLNRRSLLLGGTDKHAGDRGKFGEGYKLALLVFARQIREVTIYNGAEKWSSGFEACSDFDNAELLTIRIEPLASTQYDGVQFKIHGISLEEWQLIQERWIPDIPTGSILPREEKYRGMIYCGGLYVTKSVKLSRGYNFAPTSLVLGRDRNIASEFDIQCLTSHLWSNTRNIKDLIFLLEAKAADVEYVSYVPQQSASIIVKDFEKKWGEHTVPVINQQELDKARSHGFNAQIVPQVICRVVKAAKSFIFYQDRTPGFLMEKFYAKVKDRLPLDVCEELQTLVNEAKSWR